MSNDLHVSYQAGAMQKEKEKRGLSKDSAPAADYGTHHESMQVHPNVKARKAAVPSGHANGGTHPNLQHYTSSQG